MKEIIIVFAAAFAMSSCANQQDQHRQHTESKKANSDAVSDNPNALTDTTKKSIKAVAKGQIGNANVTINYHSPGVRKRVIWGGLVPYNDVWVTGAHSATSIELDKPFKIEGKTIPAGKYALFTIPGEDEWTVIINRNWEQHLADDYSTKDDVVRIKVKPIRKDSTLERLQYFITSKASDKGTIAMEWEKLRIEFPVQL
ncbi:MAG TPA: DUF2911 domain-containing protein [Segetibacter sp.]|jgi:hypothetical protein